MGKSVTPQDCKLTITLPDGTIIASKDRLENPIRYPDKESLNEIIHDEKISIRERSKRLIKLISVPLQCDFNQLADNEFIKEPYHSFLHSTAAIFSAEADPVLHRLYNRTIHKSFKVFEAELHASANSLDLEKFDNLLKKIDLYPLNMSGQSIVLLFKEATKKGQITLMERLFEILKKYNLGITDETKWYGFYALSDCISAFPADKEDQLVAFVDLLIKNGAILNREKDVPLTYALQRGLNKVAHQLMDAKADVDYYINSQTHGEKDSDNRPFASGTPLTMAVICCDTSVVKKILDRKPKNILYQDPNLKYNALHDALFIRWSDGEKDEIAKILIQANPDLMGKPNAKGFVNLVRKYKHEALAQFVENFEVKQSSEESKLVPRR